jgi:hypothetical protein
MPVGDANETRLLPVHGAFFTASASFQRTLGWPVAPSFEEQLLRSSGLRQPFGRDSLTLTLEHALALHTATVRVLRVCKRSCLRRQA